MNNFRDYDKKYPDLIVEIMEYFQLGTGEVKTKSVLGFCEGKAIPTNDGQGQEFVIQPSVVVKICEKLCESGVLSSVKKDGTLGLGNNYIFVNNIDLWRERRNSFSIYYNSKVYGFDYIYRIYKDAVIPIVYKSNQGDYSIGTGFKIHGGIATAKHCLEGASCISIKGYKKEELNSKKIYISQNPEIDIAFIDIVCKDPNLTSFTEDGSIMQEVLTMGYPKIPAFTDFLTAELATISCIAESRITPTKGTIAAFGENIFSKMELMLITAKIKGGNSGGPVINNNGSVVGIACQSPHFEGDYDDLGYGIAVPIKYLNEIVESKIAVLRVEAHYFVEF